MDVSRYIESGDKSQDHVSETHPVTEDRQKSKDQYASIRPRKDVNSH